MLTYVGKLCRARKVRERAWNNARHCVIAMSRFIKARSVFSAAVHLRADSWARK